MLLTDAEQFFAKVLPNAATYQKIFLELTELYVNPNTQRPHLRPLSSEGERFINVFKAKGPYLNQFAEIIGALLLTLTLEELKAISALYALPETAAIDFEARAAHASLAKEALIEHWATTQTGLPVIVTANADTQLVTLEYTLPKAFTCAETVLRGNLKNLSDSDVASCMRYFLVREMHRRAPKVYEVSAGLSKMLSLTRADTIPMSEVRFPFPLMYISLPPNTHKIENDYVTGIYFTEELYPFSPIPWIMAHFSFDIPGQQSYQHHSMGYRISSNVNIGDFMISADTVHHGGQTTTTGDMLKDQGYADTRALLKWVFNLLLYLTLPNAQIEKEAANKEYRQTYDRLKSAQGTRREKVKAQLKQLDPHYRIMVGKNVQIRHQPRVQTHRGDKEGVLPTKMEIPGHFRRIKGYRLWIEANPEKDPRDTPKLWIHPYIRGPEDGILVQPKHRAMYQSHNPEVPHGQAYQVQPPGSATT